MKTVDHSDQNCFQCGEPGFKYVEEGLLCQKCHDKLWKPAPRKAEGRIGRNEPCGCGSGKKNKKCCKK